MRRNIKIVTEWIHAAMILALILPTFHAFRIEREAQIEATIFFISLSIIIPIILTSIAIKKCRNIGQYLFICVVILAVTGVLITIVGNLLSYGSTTQVCVIATMVLSLFVVWERIKARMDQKARLESKRIQDTDWKPDSGILEKPGIYMLVYFCVIYGIGIRAASVWLCNEALICAFIYLLAALIHQYIDSTERYLSLNRRVCSLPGKRIYGIGGLVFAGVMLLLVIVSMPAFLTTSNRRYMDFQGFSMDEEYYFEEYTFNDDQLMDPSSYEVPEVNEAARKAFDVLERIFYVLGAISVIFFAVLIIKSLRGAVCRFREAQDENGDLVEPLDTIEDIEKIKTKRRRTGRRANTEREKIRREYRKTIRKYRREIPNPAETPYEIEKNAGIEKNKDMQELHESYEAARYGSRQE